MKIKLDPDLQKIAKIMTEGETKESRKLRLARAKQERRIKRNRRKAEK